MKIDLSKFTKKSGLVLATKNKGGNADRGDAPGDVAPTAPVRPPVQAD